MVSPKEIVTAKMMLYKNIKAVACLHNDFFDIDVL